MPYSQLYILFRGSVLWVFFCLLVCTSAVFAGEEDGNRRIILSGLTSSGNMQQISVKEIESLGLTEVDLDSPFLEHRTHFSGVWFDQFVSHYGTSEVANVLLTGIDKYEVSISKMDWSTYRILLVTREDGKYIGYQQKGPMRVVFPDYHPSEKHSQANLPKWIWMITEIKLK